MPVKCYRRADKNQRDIPPVKTKPLETSCEVVKDQPKKHQLEELLLPQLKREEPTLLPQLKREEPTLLPQQLPQPE